MQTPKLNLIVVRSLDPDRTADFYRLLGMEFEREQHGKGLVHLAAETGGMLFEIYPTDSPAEVDSSTRLGFVVERINEVVNSMRRLGVEVLQDAKESKWGIRAVVRDTDGRAVELTQK